MPGDVPGSRYTVRPGFSTRSTSVIPVIPVIHCVCSTWNGQDVIAVGEQQKRLVVPFVQAEARQGPGKMRRRWAGRGAAVRHRSNDTADTLASSSNGRGLLARHKVHTPTSCLVTGPRDGCKRSLTPSFISETNFAGLVARLGGCAMAGWGDRLGDCVLHVRDLWARLLYPSGARQYLLAPPWY
jgi:hypothetical protein